MARQRFIWPSIWDDPDLASITEGAMLLYIACFSLADDDGRLDGNPVFLRSQAFPYRKVSTRTVSRWRSEIAAVCPNFHIYDVDGREYIAFLNWREFQKPKYPSPSKLPAPPNAPTDTTENSGNHSGNDSGSTSRNDSSTGRDGLGSTPLPPTEKTPRRRKRRTTPITDHVSDPEAHNPHPCPHCTRKLPTTDALDQHLLNVHDHRLTPDHLADLRRRQEAHL